MASTKEPALQEVNLMTLAIPQLNQLKNQLDQVLSLFQDSIKTLKVAQTKLSSSGDCLQKLSKESEGTEMLVPLSPFMYVPGSLTEVNNVMIDVGTGYYVQKDLDGAIDYCKRKVSFITEQMEKVQELALEKSKVRDAIVEVMDVKLQSQLMKTKTTGNT
ncbi:UNVERIFIED_CONTAM: hypothetical protein PYX00_008761 [Menopon gallinae]|uniref:Prefoldin subunit 5 n=1 Tax=Menopon gallinae TaxID=328185 RepID=A0AAW2HPJ1_9NEOP